MRCGKYYDVYARQVLWQHKLMVNGSDLSVRHCQTMGIPFFFKYIDIRSKWERKIQGEEAADAKAERLNMTGVYVCEEGWHKLNLEEGKKKNQCLDGWKSCQTWTLFFR